MKSYLRILGYVKKYPLQIGGFAVSVVLMALLSGLSFTLLDPVMNILFSAEEVVPEVESPKVKLNVQNIKELAYYLVNDIAQAEGKQQALLSFILIIVALNFSGNVFRFLSNVFTAIISTKVIFNLRKDLFDKLIGKQVQFIDQQRKGDLLTRATVDIDEIERSIIGSLKGIFKSPVQIALYLLFMLQYSAKLTGFIFLVLPVTALFISVIGKSLKRNAKEGQGIMSQMVGVIDESISGLRLIKAFNAASYTSKVFSKFNAAFAGLYRKQLYKKALASPFSETSGIIAVGFILWYGGNLVFKGDLEAEGFFTYIVFFTQILQPAKELSSSVSNVYKGVASADRLFTLMDAEVKIKDRKNAPALSEFSNEISFETVSFAYEDKMVLNELDFRLEKGKFYALVGPSGCGKSTTIELLLRFFDPQKGRISLDGKDIREVSLDSLRNLTALVTQQPILFNDSVYNNVAFGLENASRVNVIEACKVAHAHDFIEELPKGYDTEIGDGGGMLSGGQRQRISIARAVLKDAPVLLLDEATSALDAESEREVQNALDEIMHTKTSLVVAHRLSTIQHADEILVMEEGQVVERGTHSELIQQEGTYWRLSQIQQLGQ